MPEVGRRGCAVEVRDKDKVFVALGIRCGLAPSWGIRRHIGHRARHGGGGQLKDALNLHYVDHSHQCGTE